MTVKELTERIESFEPVPGVTVHSYLKSGSQFVHAAGCIDAGQWRSSEDNRIYPILLKEMLDEGTKSMSRDELRLALETLGSDVSFDINGEKLLVSIEGRARAFEETLKLVRDMLMSPAFSEESFMTVRERLLNEFDDDKEDTRKRAHGALTELMFTDSSAHRLMNPDEKITRLNESTVEKLREYAATVLRGKIEFAVVGDVSREELLKQFASIFSSWNSEPSALALSPVVLNSGAQSTHVDVPGKENVDMYLGWPTPITVGSADYVPFSVALELLGGSGFTGHLMKTVRERDGLTYGIYARARDVATSLPLYAFVWGTFGNELVSRGLETTKKEIAEWIQHHITDEKLASKKREIRGSYVVSFQDPHEIAWRIMATRAGGLPISNLYEYLDRVEALQVSDIHDIAQKYLTPSHALVASAGATGD